jgi:hypothetical protein
MSTINRYISCKRLSGGSGGGLGLDLCCLFGVVLEGGFSIDIKSTKKTKCVLDAWGVTEMSRDFCLGCVAKGLSGSLPVMVVEGLFGIISEASGDANKKISFR